MDEIRLKGRPASPGYAAGPMAVFRENASGPIGGNDALPDANDLKRAIQAATGELERLAHRAGGDAAQILEFQRALLEDDTLSGAAFAAIEHGKAADAAWRDALQAEIDHYEAADDEHFRARASDLKDMRDRVILHLTGSESAREVPPGAVLAAEDLAPSRFLDADWSKGGAILLSAGSPMSHVAILARAQGIPMITGLGAAIFEGSGVALVDGTSGIAIFHAGLDSQRDFDSKRAVAIEDTARARKISTQPAVTRDGTRIAVHLNIARVEELASLDPAICDGIGLVRTEFLFQSAGSAVSEDVQCEAYREIMVWAQGRPVTIRTLDAGGDKPIRGFTQDGESNPFLGMRGIRLSLLHRNVFRTQLRALIRASAHGVMKIMLPMVTVPDELAEARAMLDAEVDGFVRQGVAVRRPQLGIMVEVPAVATAIGDFEADFYSIGSNDLTQYATAAGRDIDAVAHLATPLHPGVLRMIEMVVHHGHERGIDVSLCGDAGGDPLFVPALLGTGLRSVSVSPRVLGKAKAAIAELDLGSRTAHAVASGEPAS